MGGNMLTLKQQRFVDEYLIDLNATAAYKRAGYKGKGATSEACSSRLLSNAKVSSAIEKAMNKRAEKIGVSAEHVIKTIMETIERCRQAEPVLDKEGNPTGEYRFDASSVLRGCELLGKHLKMFTDKTEVSGLGSSVVPVLNVIIGKNLGED
jgi:phage terminase small subunit